MRTNNGQPEDIPPVVNVVAPRPRSIKLKTAGHRAVKGFKLALGRVKSWCEILETRRRPKVSEAPARMTVDEEESRHLEIENWENELRELFVKHGFNG